MTIVVAVASIDGIVMAADSQVTYGETRWQMEKIKSLNPTCVWAGAGDLGFLQRLEETLAVPNTKVPLGTIRDFLGNIARQCATTTLQLDLRTNFPFNTPVEELRPYDLLFAEFVNGAPCLLHVSPYGPEWIHEGFHAVGSGQPFAFAILQRFRGSSLSQSHAALLAYRVVHEATQVASFGLGPPIVLWVVDSRGARKLDRAEMDGLSDSYGVLLSAEIELLKSFVSKAAEPPNPGPTASSLTSPPSESSTWQPTG